MPPKSNFVYDITDTDCSAHRMAAPMAMFFWAHRMAAPMAMFFWAHRMAAPMAMFFWAHKMVALKVMFSLLSNTDFLFYGHVFSTFTH